MLGIYSHSPERSRAFLLELSRWKLCPCTLSINRCTQRLPVVTGTCDFLFFWVLEYTGQGKTDLMPLEPHPDSEGGCCGSVAQLPHCLVGVAPSHGPHCHQGSPVGHSSSLPRWYLASYSFLPLLSDLFPNSVSWDLLPPQQPLSTQVNSVPGTRKVGSADGDTVPHGSTRTTMSFLTQCHLWESKN